MESLRRLLFEKEDVINEKKAIINDRQSTIDRHSEIIQSQKARIAFLEKQLHLQKIKQFSASSEKNPHQLSLFNETEEIEEIEEQQAEPEPEDKPKKKKPSGRKGLNPDIPRVQQRIELSEAEKNGAIETYFVKAKEELDIVPAQVQVIEIMQEKAVFLSETKERKLLSASLPKHPLPKTVASTNTLAYVIVAKYMDTTLSTEKYSQPLWWQCHPHHSGQLAHSTRRTTDSLNQLDSRASMAPCVRVVVVSSNFPY